MHLKSVGECITSGCAWNAVLSWRGKFGNSVLYPFISYFSTPNTRKKEKSLTSSAMASLVNPLHQLYEI